VLQCSARSQSNNSYFLVELLRGNVVFLKRIFSTRRTAMADPVGLRGIGFAFGAVTAIVTLLAVISVATNLGPS
jgi:hypothetical protein